MKRAPALVPLLLLIALGGCARYDFNLVKPEQFATTVATKQDTVVAIDPMEYRFRNVDGYLVIRIKNPTADPIQLLGERSSAVDGGGEAHPLRTQTIPPGAYVKVILPPPRPTAYDNPYFGFEFGYNVTGPGFYQPWLYDEPRIYRLYDAGNNYYWEWRGNTTVKLTLAFDRAGKTFVQEFAFFKKKL